MYQKSVQRTGAGWTRGITGENTMHNAKLSSPRLKRVIKLLSDGKEHSTRAIIYFAHVCAVNSIISELRANRVGIDCTRRAGRYYYKLGKYQVQ